MPSGIENFAVATQKIICTPSIERDLPGIELPGLDIDL
jgi:hypothetical protein